MAKEMGANPDISAVTSLLKENIARVFGIEWI
jgi:hypothetical protein